MKHITAIIIAASLAATAAHAAKRVQYAAWLINNGHDASAVEFKGTWNDGSVSDVPVAATWPEGVAIPSEQDLPTVEAARAVIADKRKTDDADFEAWSKRERALARLFVKEINKLRAEHGLPAYTAAQVKAALKAELDD